MACSSASRAFWAASVAARSDGVGDPGILEGSERLGGYDVYAPFNEWRFVIPEDVVIARGEFYKLLFSRGECSVHGLWFCRGSSFKHGLDQKLV